MTSVRPAATGTSLKSTWEIPSHSGVDRVSDHANAQRAHERSASASASREGGDGDDRQQQVGDPLIEVRRRVVGLQRRRRAGGNAMEHVAELLQEDAVELACAGTDA